VRRVVVGRSRQSRGANGFLRSGRRLHRLDRRHPVEPVDALLSAFKSDGGAVPAPVLGVDPARLQQELGLSAKRSVGDADPSPPPDGQAEHSQVVRADVAARRRDGQRLQRLVGLARHLRPEGGAQLLFDRPAIQAERRAVNGPQRPKREQEQGRLAWGQVSGGSQ
jgi:hypothetical protein